MLTLVFDSNLVAIPSIEQTLCGNIYCKDLTKKKLWFENSRLGLEWKICFNMS